MGTGTMSRCIKIKIDPNNIDLSILSNEHNKRDIFRMRVLEHMFFTEIAKKLGKHRHTVVYHYKRACIELKEAQIKKG